MKRFNRAPANTLKASRSRQTSKATEVGRAVCVVLGLVSAVWAQLALAEAPTIKQSLEIKRPLAPQISPDCSAVAYELTRTNWASDRFDHDIWLVSASGGGAPRRLSALDATAEAAAWSPEGRRLAFLSDHPPGATTRGDMQIVVFDTQSGEARQVSHAPLGVSGFRWSPDGSRIAYVATDPTSSEASGSGAHDGQRHLPERQPASRVWELTLGRAGSEPRPISPGGLVASEVAYSPDGRRLAIVAQSVDEPALTPHVGLYAVQTSGAGWRRLVGDAGSLKSPVWSPAGDRIAYLVTDAHAYLHSNARVVAVAATGGATEVLDPAFDLDPDLVAWTRSGIVLDAYERTSSRLFNLNPVTRSVRAASPSGELLEAPSISPDGRCAAFLKASEGEGSDVFVSSAAHWAPRRLTRTADQYLAFSHSTRELVQWRAPDGVQIEGVLEKPATYDKRHRYPLLVVLHGGPDWLDTPYRSADRLYPVERFLQRGALVLHVNYRGSLGYGSAFRALDYRAIGKPQYDDVISGVDQLAERGLVDKNRVGLMGWSAGGFISAFASTYSGRFRAISVGGGITDWRSFYLTSDLPQEPVETLGATPFQDPAVYASTSPITYSPSARTPTLIQHGQNDPRVPVSQALELYRVLADRHVPVKATLFTQAGHQLGKPSQQFEAMKENEDWFSHYVIAD